MIDAASGLPLSIDESTGALSFHDGLLCETESGKTLGQMAGLFRSVAGEDPGRPVYRAYRNIRFAEHERLFSEQGMRYDITVVIPGTSCGELFKTSGHYHGAGPGQALPFPEVYEVVKGTIGFVLQYDPLFDTPDEGAPADVRVVVAHEGETVVIPAFAGHGSINLADEVSAFSNIAVASCPVLYDAVQAHHGLAAYVMRGDGGVQLVANESYDLEGTPRFARPLEAPDLGIVFGSPCYRAYVADPACYAWLLDCEPHDERIVGLTELIEEGSL